MLIKKVIIAICATACCGLLCSCEDVTASHPAAALATIQVPTDFNVVDKCLELGISEETIEILDSNSISLLEKFLYYTGLTDFTIEKSVNDYLENIYIWLDNLWIEHEFGDSYLYITGHGADNIEVTLYQGSDTFKFTIPFKCNVPPEKFPTAEVISIPKEDTSIVKLADDVSVCVHENIQSDDTLQWVYIAHNAGFLPSTLPTASDAGDIDTLYKFFYCYYSERDKLPEISTLSTLMSMDSELSEKYPDWELNVYLDYVEWSFGGCRFTVNDVSPDMILELRKDYPHIINKAYPTNKLSVYGTQFIQSAGKAIVVIPDVSKLNVKDLKVPYKIRKYPKAVQQCFLRILQASKLFNLYEADDVVGFCNSIENYVDGSDNCIVENLSSESLHLIIHIQCKNKIYTMTIIPEEIYYGKEVLD